MRLIDLGFHLFLVCHMLMVAILPRRGMQSQSMWQHTERYSLPVLFEKLLAINK